MRKIIRGTILAVSLLLMTNGVSVVADKKNDTIYEQLDEYTNYISETSSLTKTQINRLLYVNGNIEYGGVNASITENLATNNLFDGIQDIEIEIADVSSVNKQVRGDKRYLPDMLHTVVKYVENNMNKQYTMDRGKYQRYFDSFTNELKQEIVFYETVLKLYGASEEVALGVTELYLLIVYNKQEGERVVRIQSDGSLAVEAKYINSINKILGNDEKVMRVFIKLLATDKIIFDNDMLTDYINGIVLPYDLDNKTRDNLMVAAASLVGKVRYVWGGGHAGTSNMNGISEAWIKFNDYYLNSDEYKATCIKPNGSWCPEHGFVTGPDGCLGSSAYVYSANEYMTKRIELMDIYNKSMFIDMINKQTDVLKGTRLHRLDGLDCSGYVGWVYNQVSTEEYRGLSFEFIDNNGLTEIKNFTTMQTGDVVAWYEHIIMIVGKANEAGTVYNTIEMSPNMVKFGVIYNGKSNTTDRNKAYAISKEANQLFGAFDKNEGTWMYNFDTLNARIGRDEFDDEYKEQYGVEVIQGIIDDMSIEYLLGVSEYNGETFSIK